MYLCTRFECKAILERREEKIEAIGRKKFFQQVLAEFEKELLPLQSGSPEGEDRKYAEKRTMESTNVL